MWLGRIETLTSAQRMIGQACSSGTIQSLTFSAVSWPFSCSPLTASRAFPSRQTVDANAVLSKGAHIGACYWINGAIRSPLCCRCCFADAHANLPKAQLTCSEAYQLQKPPCSPPVRSRLWRHNPEGCGCAAWHLVNLRQAAVPFIQASDTRHNEFSKIASKVLCIHQYLDQSIYW